MLVTTLEVGNFDHTKMNRHLISGSIGIASPTSPTFVSKQLTDLFHTQPLFSTVVYLSAASIINCVL